MLREPRRARAHIKLQTNDVNFQKRVTEEAFCAENRRNFAEQCTRTKVAQVFFGHWILNVSTHTANGLLLSCFGGFIIQLQSQGYSSSK
jgi:hypothetical protein